MKKAASTKTVKNYPVIVKLPWIAIEGEWTSCGRIEELKTYLQAWGFSGAPIAYSSTCRGVVVVHCSKTGAVGLLKRRGFDARRATEAGVRADLNGCDLFLCIKDTRTSVRIDADVANLMMCPVINGGMAEAG